MKKQILIGLAAIACTLNAQNNTNITFEHVLPPAPAPQIIPAIEVVEYGSMAFSDIDGDNDQDVFISGENANRDLIGKLYKNDGSGNYTEVTDSPLEGLCGGSVVFSDIDGDNDPDVLITGYNSDDDFFNKLYINDGSGTFTEVIDTPFEAVYHSFIAFSDIDRDNDQDVLITGRNDNGDPISKLYKNDGNGTFTEVVDTPFEAVSAGSIAFSDIDGDNDPDVLITGRNENRDPISKLYTNDGSGTFTEVVDTPFEGVEYSSIAFCDVDGDDDPDVLITGRNASNTDISKLYKNDGSGTFTEVLDTPFSKGKGVFAFSDVDGDNDPDLLIAEATSGWDQIGKLYKNDGSGNFTEVRDTPFQVLNSYEHMIFSDIDGDNDPDLLMAGSFGPGGGYTALFLNDGKGNYTEVTGGPFEFRSASSIAFSDVNGDSNPDVLITRSTNRNDAVTKLYNIEGNGSYAEVMDVPFVGVYNSFVAFSDIDNDNDQDVMITGRNATNYSEISKLYKNDGTGTFTEVMDIPFDDVSMGSIVFCDIDGDNDADVLITGSNIGGRISKLYRNDGSGTFSEVTDTPFEGVSESSVGFIDMDGDNDADVLITGYNGNNSIAKLYENLGSGKFAEVNGTSFEGVTRGSLVISDIDSDNDLDIVIAGSKDRSSREKVTNIYHNDGHGTFTKAINTIFDGLNSSFVAMRDFDGDNDQDLLVSGNESGVYYTKFFHNDGQGTFTESIGSTLDISVNRIAISDIDGDQKLDLLISGQNKTGSVIYLYRNTTGVSTNLGEKSKQLNTSKLFPNPTNGEINLLLDQVYNDIHINVSNLSGQVIKQHTFYSVNSVRFDLDGDPGIYIIEIVTGQNREVFKVNKL